MRDLAQAFSTRVIRELSRSTPSRWAWERLSPLVDLVGADEPLSAAFEAAYERLLREYRCEYVYKTALIGQALASDPTANTMTALPVFMSIADIVVAGETARAYEVKTDLDSFARLDLQVLSYSRCFEHVYVVTSAKKVGRALVEVPDYVGILTFDSSTTLTEARPACGGVSRLDITTLFRVLRQSERLAVLDRQLGYRIDVPPALLYRRTAELFTGLSIECAYTEFVAELNQRDAGQRTVIQEIGLPRSLIAAAAGLSLSVVGWRRLGAALQQPLTELAGRQAA